MENVLHRRRGVSAGASSGDEASECYGIRAHETHRSTNVGASSNGVLDGKTAVVVGAGPAGMLAAMQLAQHSASVQVFESRAFNYDEAGNKWFLVLSERGLSGLKAAGIDVAESPESIRYAGLHAIGVDGKCIPIRPKRAPVEIQCTRGMLTRYVQEEAMRLCPSIKVRFECKLRAGDLQARKLEFEDLTSGETFCVQGDLLVGAEGANSKMRALMRQQVSGFSIDEQPPINSVCTFPLSKLPPVGDLGSHGRPFQMFPGGDDRDEWLGKGNVLTFIFAKAGQRSTVGMLLNTLASGETTCSFGMSKSAWEREYTEASVCEEILTEFPQLPGCIRAELIPVLCNPPMLRPLPASVKCSAISAPGVVLMGDAARTVSPALGLGANMAMEDSVLLRAAIKQSQGDITKLCQAYNDLRLEDSRALVDLDRAWWAVKDAAPGSFLSKLWAAGPLVVTSILCKYTAGLPGRFRVQDPVLLARLGLLRMCQVRRWLLWNTAVASFLALGFVAMAIAALLAIMKLVHF